MTLKVLILGINGFIGNSLAEQIIQQKDWHVYGMDLASDRLGDFIDHPRMHFTEGDITIHKEWVEYHLKKCDVILPLVAIATPASYVQEPLQVFALDFKANLPIVERCAELGKRLIFPSTSEVYGMCHDPEFDEHESNLVQGPIHKQRWIYSCSKQLLDRVIYAHGVKHNLPYTLFRPFNWIGPKQDNILNPKQGGSRVITQFIGDIIRGNDLTLVDGGEQRRTFIDIDDGIVALLKIIENRHNCAHQQIFNIGNPKNNASIREVAELLLTLLKTHPKYRNMAEKIRLLDVSADQYYGKGYQDIQNRIPSIAKAKELLDWEPKVDLTTMLGKILDYHIQILAKAEVA